MAFRRRRRDTRLETAAKNIGGTLGSLAGRVDRLNQQRAAVAAEIRAVVGAAQALLDDLGDDVAIMRRRARKAVRKAGRRRRNVARAVRAKL